MNENVELTKQFIDAVHLAKRISGMMPELPDHLTPRHIRIMEHVCHASDDGIRISEIAKRIHSTTPSITKLVNELAAKQLVRKNRDQQDRRVCSVHATAAGKELYHLYGDEYHRRLSVLLDDIPEADMRTAIQVIWKAYDLMSSHPIRLDNSQDPSI